MAETGFPGTYSATTVTADSRANTEIRFDPSYVRTVPGILKVACLVLNFIGFLCIMVSENSYHSRAGWFNFCAGTGFWVTGILLALYLFHVVEKLQFIPWLMVEFGYCAAWSFFYLTAAAACAAEGGRYEGWAAASFFGFVAMVVYGVDAFFKFKAWKGGDIAQGERVSHVSSGSVPVTPAY